jgi:hypothetical protein
MFFNVVLHGKTHVSYILHIKTPNLKPDKKCKAKTRKSKNCHFSSLNFFSFKFFMNPSFDNTRLQAIILITESVAFWLLQATHATCKFFQF